MVAEAVKEAVAALPEPKAGKDGVGINDLFRAEGGHLVAVLTDGTTKDLDKFVGKDGDDGEPGLGFDDLDLLHDGERTFTFKMYRGEQTLERSFVIPVMLDRGIYDEKATYEKGDAVTYGGSVWIAQGITRDKPNTGKGWRLAVKRGAKGSTTTVKAKPDPAPLKIGGPTDADK